MDAVDGTKTTGAENDIEQATCLARNMVTRWGMSERPEMVQPAPRENPYLAGRDGLGDEKPFGKETGRLIDAEVLGILNECHAEAHRLFEAHRRQLDLLVLTLLAWETLDEQEILDVTGLPAVPTLETRKIPYATKSSNFKGTFSLLPPRTAADAYPVVILSPNPIMRRKFSYPSRSPTVTWPTQDGRESDPLAQTHSSASQARRLGAGNRPLCRGASSPLRA